MDALASLPSASSLMGDATPRISSLPDKAAKEMEGMFLSLLVKEMRQTIGSENGFAGDPSDTIGGLYDQLMGDHLTNSGGIGLADSVRDALLRKTHS